MKEGAYLGNNQSNARDHLILFADLVGSTDVACEMSIDAYASTYIASFHWAAERAYDLLLYLGKDLEEKSKFESLIPREDWRIIGDELLSITFLNGRSESSQQSLVACACAFAYNLKLFWLISPYNLSRLQNQQFPRELSIGMHIGPLATISSSKDVAESKIGLHLNVAKRIETEARNGFDSRVFASSDIIHLFSDWKDRFGNQECLSRPPLSFAEFRVVRTTVSAKGIARPLRVYELQWSKNLFENEGLWKDKEFGVFANSVNAWTIAADAVADVCFPRAGGIDDCSDSPLAGDSFQLWGIVCSDLWEMLRSEEAYYINAWFSAMRFRPRIFSDERWLLQNTYFITLAFSRRIERQGEVGDRKTNYAKMCQILSRELQVLSERMVEEAKGD